MRRMFATYRDGKCGVTLIPETQEDIDTILEMIKNGEYDPGVTLEEYEHAVKIGEIKPKPRA